VKQRLWFVCYIAWKACSDQYLNELEFCFKTSTGNATPLNTSYKFVFFFENTLQSVEMIVLDFCPSVKV
jgi:hypothetical protein